MNNKDLQILRSLLDYYKEMYKSKELFNKVFFKYTPEEMQNALESVISLEKSSVVQYTPKIRDSILAIKNEEEVKNFFIQNLMYDHSNPESKDECLNSISLSELKFLYNVIFSSPIRANVKKGELLDIIEKHFENIERALNMKP